MEKLVYVLWKRESLAPRDFREALLGSAARRLLARGARRLAVNVVDEHVGHALPTRITHLDPPIAAMVSFWLDAADDRVPLEADLAELTARITGYLVVESVPIVNTTHTAPCGERTPGVNVVTCIERPGRIENDAWIEHWHGHHKRVAIETQCTYSYVRNVVVRPLSKDAPAWAGVVEEGFPSEAVANPMLRYCAAGSPETLKRNLARMLESCQAFLDLDRVESHPMSEYRISD